MITQENLNSEIDLSKRIYLYYWDKMANFMSVGSDKYTSWYKDLCVLYFLSKSLLNLQLVDDKLYLGSIEVDEDYFNLMTQDIREYLTYEIREVVYSELDEQGNVKDTVIPTIPPTIVTYQGFNQDWRSTIIPIVLDDVTEVMLPFNINDTDPDSIRITVNDNDPIHLVAPAEEGCHIIDTTLYWHTYYNLKAGDKLFIQYLVNNNSTGAINQSMYIQTASSPITDYTSIGTWTDLSVIGSGSFILTTEVFVGYAYIYITTPSSKTAKFYNELGYNVTDTYTYVGDITLNNGSVNKVYKKNDQFNTTININLTVKLS